MTENASPRTVLIPQDIADEGKRYLRERGYRLMMGSGGDENTLCREIRDCAAVLVRKARITESVLAAAPYLRVIAKHGIGVDNIDVAAATARGIYVTNAPLSNAATVAEYTIGMIVALARNFVPSDRAVRAGDYSLRDRQLGIDLAGKTVGLIGLGRIGRMVARKAALGLDMTVIGYDPHPDVNALQDVPVQILDSRDTVFARADFVSLHLPALPETRHSVGVRELALMRPTAYLINAARGEIVDETALIDALENNRIAGAALDVFADEPPLPDNPLFRLANVIVTPHNAALTREATVRMALDAARGIEEVLSGRPPSWPVNRLEGRLV